MHENTWNLAEHASLKEFISRDKTRQRVMTAVTEPVSGTWPFVLAWKWKRWLAELAGASQV